MNAIDVAIYADMDAVAADARGALDRAHQASLFDRLDWFRLTLEHCPPSGSLLVVRARDAQNNSAWLFLMRNRSRATTLSSWYSMETGLVTTGINGHALGRAIAHHLRSLAIGQIMFSPLQSERAVLLAEVFEQEGWLATTYESSTNWTVSTRGVAWPDYWSARPSRLRNTIERKQKAHELTTAISHMFDENMWLSYYDIYNSSWKPAEGSFEFLRALAELESTQGTLRLGVAHHKGHAVASQLWLVENGIATIHKLAHREEAQALSPGSILSAAMFRHVIERDKVDLINFGTGDEPYKKDWMDTRRPLFQVQFFNPATLTGMLGKARQAVSSLVHHGRRD
jgi:CelD/BcsL family acetyltransferase involved in cellulose biosynthesis